MNSNKKVVLVEIAGKGGICHYTYNLAEALSQYRSVVLATGEKYEMQDRDRRFHWVAIFNRLKTNPLHIITLLRVCGAKDVSCVHIQASQYPVFIYVLVCLLKVFVRKPVVITAHNVVTHEQKKWEYAVYKRIYRLANGIIVHAEANKQEMVALFSIKAEKISVIPHGNYTFFNTNSAVLKHEDLCNVLFFGYIRKYKGLMYLIEAMKLVRERVPAARLIIAGRAVEDFSEYQATIDRLDLHDAIEKNLEYLTFQQVQEYFTRASVVAMPYEHIYQSGVVQVAYGFSKPVVATNVGGFPEAVEDGKSGFIVPPRDSHALADKITTILQDKKLQNEMGAYGLYLAQTKFSWHSIAHTTNDLYNILTEYIVYR